MHERETERNTQNLVTYLAQFLGKTNVSTLDLFVGKYRRTVARMTWTILTPYFFTLSVFVRDIFSTWLAARSAKQGLFWRVIGWSVIPANPVPTDIGRGWSSEWIHVGTMARALMSFDRLYPARGSRRRVWAEVNYGSRTYFRLGPPITILQLTIRRAFLHGRCIDA